MPKALQICSIPGCPELTGSGGRCPTHERTADRARGTAAERGYSGKRWRNARRITLRRDPVCVLCHIQEATVADHHPVSRRDLVRLGVSDPDAPHRMRGLCSSCHGIATAHDQPGGWNRDR